MDRVGATCESLRDNWSGFSLDFKFRAGDSVASVHVTRPGWMEIIKGRYGGGVLNNGEIEPYFFDLD